MLKKLTEEKLSEVLEAGIREFADKGFNDASMSSIAKRAGISVGVLYKYYENKDDFFNACIRRCISELDHFLHELCEQEMKPLQYAQALISSVQQFSRQHKDYIRLYLEVTRTADSQRAALFAREIEGMSSRLYTEIVARAQDEGNIRRDLDPRLFAFFMDNLLMMMQFSYCCPYYQERFKLYGGENALEDSTLVPSQLLKFLESAFTLEQADIPHTQKTEAPK